MKTCTYIRLLEQADRTTDQEAQLQLYREADRLLIEEAICVPLFYGRSHLLVKPWVRRVPFYGFRMFWKDVVIEPHD